MSKPIPRRDFIKLGGAAAAAAIFPTIIPAEVLGENAPSKRVNFACIGCGEIGRVNLDTALTLRDRGVHVGAVCDVDLVRARSAARRVDEKYGQTGCPAFGDFREITRNPDIDAVVVSTPDHWHALLGIEAVRHGKDVYIEKPLTLTVEEGRVLVAEMQRHGRVGQTGTQQRSGLYFRQAAELVRNGRLGKISHVEVFVPMNNSFSPATWQEEPVPSDFDYDMWLGPAPWAPFTRQRTHYQFRFILDYALGQTTNWGTHYIDIVQWALGMDESGPVSFEGVGAFPTSGLFTAPTMIDFTCRYASGVTLRVRNRDNGENDGQLVFHGERGWLAASRRGPQAEHREILREKIGPDEIQLYRSRHHMGNFLDCIHSRQAPISDLAIGHRSTSICNLGMIAMQLRRPLEWDPAKEEFKNDTAANRMLSRAMRGPWSLA